MRKSGRVIYTFIDKKTGNKKFALVLDNSETENACNIGQTEGQNSSGCSSCQGCKFKQSLSTDEKSGGLLSVLGNRVTAINKSGISVKAGDLVVLEIQNAKAKLQALSSVLMPELFSVAFAVFFYLFLKTEIATIGGLFAGLAAGGAVSLAVKKVLGDSALPEIVETI